MHFAAETHVDNSFGNSFSFTSNNVIGTQVLLEASCKAQIRRFLHVSTDEVYGENTSEFETGFSESHRREPTNPYAATKAAAEMLVKAYGRSYGIPYVITRGNRYCSDSFGEFYNAICNFNIKDLSKIQENSTKCLIANKFHL